MAVKKELKRRRREIDCEMALGNWRANAYSQDMVLRMTDDLELMMLENEKMVSITPWLLKYKISYDSVARFKERFPEFKARYNNVLELFASRMGDFAFWKQGDFNTFRFVAPVYSSRFKALEKWRAKMKDDSVSRPQIIYVERPNVTTNIPHCQTNTDGALERDRGVEQRQERE